MASNGVTGSIRSKMKNKGIGRIQAVRELINEGKLSRDKSGNLRTGAGGGGPRARVEWEKRKKLKK